ncbi:MAG: lipoate--protein ligase family protein [Oscillospiraceae bacterium]|jgi:lipoate-protein ligase A|nr:lipoate--protein ligase family protein [Oscillospiraceae bacterium]
MATMLLLTHSRTEPGFNLACEEYFLTQTDLELDIFWRNTPVVVVGRNQDAFLEADGEYLHEHGIGLVRRITGGGAVYHDLGNICYTHIRRYNGPVDFQRFAAPMVEALRNLGLDAEFAGRNDILIHGKKVSGTAQTIWKGRVLHHGTLLYDVNMANLTGVLRVSEEKYKGRGIASVAARVANIRPMMKEGVSAEAFMEKLAGLWDGAEQYDLSARDLTEIETLRREVYENPKWIKDKIR